MPTLYDINENLAAMLAEAQEFDESTPVNVTDEWMARFTEAQGEQTEKLEAIMMVRQNAIAEQQAIDFEIQRLSAKKTSAAKLEARMIGMLDQFMQMDGREEIKTDRFTAKYQNNPAKMVMTDEAIAELEKSLNIPKLTDYLKTAKSAMSDTKKELKDRLKKGEPAPGCELVQTRRLVIK